MVWLIGLSGAWTDEVAPPITPETLVGIWEAAPIAGQVYRLDIRPSGPSYLACIIGSEQLAYRLTSNRIEHGRVTLRFQCMTDRRVTQFPHGGPDMNDLEISGKGNAVEVWGTIQAAVKMRYRALDPVESTSVLFWKPAWLQQAAKDAKTCETLIQQIKP